MTSPPELSAAAKRTLGFGLLTALSSVALGPVFALAELFNGDDLRDGWLTGILSVGGGCAVVLGGVGCGIATVLSALLAITSQSPRDRNAARIGLAMVALPVLVMLWGQVRQDGSAPRAVEPEPQRDRACEARALAGDPCPPK